MEVSNIKLLNVKQPWAWALVNGFKTVENRSKDISSDHRFVWTAIVASKSKPTRKDTSQQYQIGSRFGR